MGNDEIKKQRSQKFFSDTTNPNGQSNPQSGVDELKEKVALRVSLSNIQKDYGYNIQMFNIINQNSIPLSQSENLEKDSVGNAVLNTSILIQYFFEREQPLLVNIVKSKEGLPPENYRVQTTLGCRPYFNYFLDLTNDGIDEIILSCGQYSTKGTIDMLYKFVDDEFKIQISNQ